MLFSWASVTTVISFTLPTAMAPHLCLLSLLWHPCGLEWPNSTKVSFGHPERVVRTWQWSAWSPSLDSYYFIPIILHTCYHWAQGGFSPRVYHTEPRCVWSHATMISGIFWTLIEPGHCSPSGPNSGKFFEGTDLLLTEMGNSRYQMSSLGRVLKQALSLRMAEDECFSSF